MKFSCIKVYTVESRDEFRDLIANKTTVWIAFSHTTYPDIVKSPKPDQYIKNMFPVFEIAKLTPNFMLVG